MARQPRHPEYRGLTNEPVQKAMNTLFNAKCEGRITEEESQIIMPILDASFDPIEKLELTKIKKRTISNQK